MITSAQTGKVVCKLRRRLQATFASSVTSITRARGYPFRGPKDAAETCETG